MGGRCKETVLAILLKVPVRRPACNYEPESPGVWAQATYLKLNCVGVMISHTKNGCRFIEGGAGLHGACSMVGIVEKTECLVLIGC